MKKIRSNSKNLRIKRKERIKKQAKTTNSGRGIDSKVRDHNGRERGRKRFGPREINKGKFRRTKFKMHGRYKAFRYQHKILKLKIFFQIG